MKYNRQIIVILALLALPKIFFAQNSSYIHPTKYDWQPIAQQITNGCRTQHEQAKAIYDWLSQNISYDITYTIYSADQCWEQRKGVCQAYSELFYHFAKAVGLDVDIATGIARMTNGDTCSHAWIVAHADGKQLLIDPTWGAGSLVDHQFVSQPNDHWFDVDPYMMILSHHPSDPSLQLLPKTISLSRFLQFIPAPTPEVIKMGLDPKHIYSLASQRRVDQFVYIFSNNTNVFDKPRAEGKSRSVCTMPRRENEGCEETNEIKLLDIPLSYQLRVGQYYTVRLLRPNSNMHIATWCGSNIINHPFVYKGDTAEASILPFMEGPLRIAIRNSDDEPFTTFLEYTVAKPTKAEVELQEKADPLASPRLMEIKGYNQRIMRKLHVDGHALLAAVKSGKCTSLPVFYNPEPFDIDLLAFPYTSTLKAGREYTITLRQHAEGEWAVVCGNEGLTEWQSNPDQSKTIHFTPKAGEAVQLAFKAPGRSQYKVCIGYKVE